MVDFFLNEQKRFLRTGKIDHFWAHDWEQHIVVRVNLGLSLLPCAGETYLRWWKSWNSGEGSKGRWYPQCDTVVISRAMVNHRVVVTRCDPRRIGPIMAGSMLDSCGSQGIGHFTKNTTPYCCEPYLTCTELCDLIFLKGLFSHQPCVRPANMTTVI